MASKHYAKLLPYFCAQVAEISMATGHAPSSGWVCAGAYGSRPQEAEVPPLLSSIFRGQSNAEETAVTWKHPHRYHVRQGYVWRREWA